jgi:hypothetical protein
VCGPPATSANPPRQQDRQTAITLLEVERDGERRLELEGMPARLGFHERGGPVFPDQRQLTVASRLHTVKARLDHHGLVAPARETGSLVEPHELHERLLAQTADRIHGRRA